MKPTCAICGTKQVNWYREYQSYLCSLCSRVVNNPNVADSPVLPVYHKYRCTDGKNIYRVEFLTASEADEHNIASRDSTDGNIWWEMVPFDEYDTTIRTS